MPVTSERLKRVWREMRFQSGAQSDSTRGDVPFISALVMFGVVTSGFPDIAIATWQFSPVLQERAEVNDNRRLVVDPAQTVVGSISDLRVVALRESESTELSITPRTRFSQYTGEQDFDTNEFFLDTRLSIEQSRWAWEGEVSGSRTSTLTSELTDSGFLVSDRNRREVEANSSFEYSIGERNSFSMSGAFSDVKFEDVEETQFSDFTFLSLSTLWTHRIYEDTDVFVTLGFSRFEAITNPSISRTVNYSFGLSHVFSPSLSGSFGFGQILSTFRFEDFVRFSDLGFNGAIGDLPVLSSDGQLQPVEREGNAAGVQLNVSLQKQYRTGRIVAEFNRQVRPSSLGAQRTSDRAELSGIYAFTSRWRAETSLLWLNEDSEAPIVNSFLATRLQRRFLSVSIGTSYQIREELQLSMRFVRRQQTQPQLSDQRLAGNIVSVALTYRPGPYRWP